MTTDVLRQERYRMTRPIGHGAMGTVMLAQLAPVQTPNVEWRG